MPWQTISLKLQQHWPKRNEASGRGKRNRVSLFTALRNRPTCHPPWGPLRIWNFLVALPLPSIHCMLRAGACLRLCGDVYEFVRRLLHTCIIFRFHIRHICILYDAHLLEHFAGILVSSPYSKTHTVFSYKSRKRYPRNGTESMLLLIYKAEVMCCIYLEF